ncbi:MAG: ComF family protein [Acidobacteriota bacterium]
MAQLDTRLLGQLCVRPHAHPHHHQLRTTSHFLKSGPKNFADRRTCDVIGFVKPVRLIKQIAQSLIFPQPCVLCAGRALNPDCSPLCQACLQSLQPLGGRICHRCGVPVPGNLLELFATCGRCRSEATPFDFARAWGNYEGDLRRIIHRFKFGGYRRLAGPLGALLEVCYRRGATGLQGDWIIPVPSHRKRSRERGFDHTLLLGQSLSRRLKIPLFRGLARNRNTAPQFGLDRKDRRRNVRGAFSLRETAALSKKTALLVDDVMTTGTTVGEISSLLRQQSELEQIMVLVVARTPLLRG